MAPDSKYYERTNEDFDFAEAIRDLAVEVSDLKIAIGSLGDELDNLIKNVSSLEDSIKDNERTSEMEDTIDRVKRALTPRSKKHGPTDRIRYRTRSAEYPFTAR